MASHFYPLDEILNLIKKGKAFLLVEPLFDEHANLLLGTEKVLTDRDLEKVRNRYPSVFQKPLHVRTTVPHFIAEEQRIKWVAYLLSLFREDEFYRDLSEHSRQFITKYMKNLLVENDYVIWKLSQVKNFSKKLFRHSVHTCFISLILYFYYNQSKFQGMINGHDVNNVISAALLHDIGLMKFPAGVVEKKRIEIPETEFLKYSQHAIYSFQMLEAEASRHELDQEVLDAVLNHEERINGKGFPRGIEVDSMSFLAQLISIADYFSLITLGEWTMRDRPYREHIAKMRKEKDGFNAELVATLDLAFKYLFVV